MKNTIITSISALVFLAIGLFIGKSNKQIEIQTVVKTNIVEKPVEKIVEKIVELPSKSIKNEYTNLSSIELPPNIESIMISVVIDDKISNYITKDEIETKIELELRRVGIKIEKTAENSDALIAYTLSAIELKNGFNQFVLTSKLNLWRYVIIDFKDKKYIKPAVIWDDDYFGLLPAKELNKDTHSTLSRQMDKLSNSILKSK